MRKSEALLTLALVGSAALSLWLWSELRAERTHHAELSARVNVPAPAAAMPDPATPQPAPAAPAPASVPASAEPASPESSRFMQAQQDGQAHQRRLMQDPKYREAWRQQQRLTYTPRRENLIRLLGLSPEQSDAVIELQLDREIGWIEQVPDTPELQEADERDHQAKLGALLGEEKRVQLQAYMESRGSRMQVDRFRAQMTGADALRDDQVEPLIAALHVENAQMRKELDEFGASLATSGNADTSQQYYEHSIEKMKETHARMHSAAAPILTNAQLAKLDDMLKRELARQEAHASMARVQSTIAK